MDIHYEIHIKGIVQGVGFRPFIYKLANSLQLKGSVSNNTEGVLIEVEGDRKQCNTFINTITNEKPSLSKIYSINIIEKELKQYLEFTIIESSVSLQKSAFYSPDVNLCNDCLTELFNKKDRRYKYPFITCINCGPRFSIVKNIPYDRNNTSMDVFTMCDNCLKEYNDPASRRHHTQPNACHICGPKIILKEKNGEIISENISTVVSILIQRIKKGNICAIKSVGGYHLCCDAKDQIAVKVLRERKNRPFKPFAMMMSSINEVKKYYELSDKEEALLCSKERPIVLLKSKVKSDTLVAPGLSYHGIMLPYTPFHHLLFENQNNLQLIMTSGNISEEPIVYQDDRSLEELDKIVDFYITYDREIIGQSDDSVMFVEKNVPFFIRRSRGYVPIPFYFDHKYFDMLALGGDLKNSFAISKDQFVILSQYLGDMAELKTYEAYEKTISHFLKIYDLNPEVIVCDAHPNYYSKNILSKMANKRVIEIQHHHAHIAGVLIDNNYDEQVIGLAFDGTGYGDDGTIWGSEFLIADKRQFKRIASFEPFRLPGGDEAVKDVWKIGLSLLYNIFKTDIPEKFNHVKSEQVIELLEKNINCPFTSSLGRIFDGVAAICGISYTVSTEAEAAILLEEMASGVTTNSYFIIPYSKDNGIYKADTTSLVKDITHLILQEKSIEEISAIFHNSIVELIISIVLLIRKNFNINTLALSGGVFQNRILLRNLIDRAEGEGFSLLLPKNVAFNDSSLALGQIAIANEILLKEKE